MGLRNQRDYLRWTQRKTGFSPGMQLLMPNGTPSHLAATECTDCYNNQRGGYVFSSFRSSDLSQSI